MLRFDVQESKLVLKGETPLASCVTNLVKNIVKALPLSPASIPRLPTHLSCSPRPCRLCDCFCLPPLPTSSVTLCPSHVTMLADNCDMMMMIMKETRLYGKRALM